MDNQLKKCPHCKNSTTTEALFNNVSKFLYNGFNENDTDFETSEKKWQCAIKCPHCELEVLETIHQDYTDKELYDLINKSFSFHNRKTKEECPHCQQLCEISDSIDSEFTYPSTRDRKKWNVGCNAYGTGCGFRVYFYPENDKDAFKKAKDIWINLG